MKIPQDARLKLLFKPYGSKRLKKPKELRISIQEENAPVKPFFSYKFLKGLKKNQWKSKKVSLNQYENKIVRLSFRLIPSGESPGHPEGLFLRPLLITNKQSKKKELSSENLKIDPEKLKQTNVIIIILDAARSDHFSCYGYHRLTTPCIDHLAEEGALFKNAFSVASFTIASTTSLFTSLSPYTHHVDRWKEEIPEKLKTLTEILKKNGYSTYGSGLVMKWQWGRKGFQEIFSFDIDTKESGENTLNSFLKEKFAHKENEPPAFIYIHLRPPHAPYNPPPEFDKWSEPEKRSKYAILIEGLTLRKIDQGKRSITQEELRFIIDKYDGNLLWGDWLVDLILRNLRDFGLYENSLVILTSDHGEAFLEHGKMLHNSTVYDEMIRIPLIMKFPSYIKPKKKQIKAHVDILDVMPTVLDFLQIEPPLNMQGKSLLPIIFGSTDQAKPYLLARAYLDEVFSFSDSQYKYIQTSSKGELFHLDSDPQERFNLALRKPILFGYYRTLANFYLQQTAHALLIKPTEAELDEELKEKLRSLGYLE